jgi:hypothetical protein
MVRAIRQFVIIIAPATLVKIVQIVQVIAAVRRASLVIAPLKLAIENLGQCLNGQHPLLLTKPKERNGATKGPGMFVPSVTRMTLQRSTTHPINAKHALFVLILGEKRIIKIAGKKNMLHVITKALAEPLREIPPKMGS